MKALYLTGPGDFDLRDEPSPDPGPGQVAVRLTVVGVCGSDRHYLEADYPHDFAAAPLVPGHEGAGEVVAVGSGVDEGLLGRHVAIEPARPCRRCEACRGGHGNACPHVAFLGYPPYHGLMRERVVCDASQLEADPAGRLSDDDLMMLEPLAIALNAIDVAGFRPGFSAAVVGCGAIGLSILAALRASGADLLIATDRLEHKEAWARRYGADAFLGPERDDVEAESMRLTDGRGVDVAFECAGDLSAQNQALSLVRPVGALAILGINPDEEVRLHAPTLRRRMVAVHYVRRSNETLRRSIRLASRYGLGLGEMVTHRYAIEDAPRAFAEFVDYAGGMVKAAIVFD